MKKIIEKMTRENLSSYKITNGIFAKIEDEKGGSEFCFGNEKNVLGEAGSFGKVIRAQIYDPQTGAIHPTRAIAIKIIPAKLFKEEEHKILSLNIKTYKIIKDGKNILIPQELVPGAPIWIDKHLRNWHPDLKKLSPAYLLTLIVAILEKFYDLHHYHINKNYIIGHFDVKGANIMVYFEWENKSLKRITIKIVDFGLSQILTSDDPNLLTLFRVEGNKYYPLESKPNVSFKLLNSSQKLALNKIYITKQNGVIKYTILTTNRKIVQSISEQDLIAQSPHLKKNISTKFKAIVASDMSSFKFFLPIITKILQNRDHYPKPMMGIKSEIYQLAGVIAFLSQYKKNNDIMSSIFSSTYSLANFGRLPDFNFDDQTNGIFVGFLNRMRHSDYFSRPAIHEAIIFFTKLKLLHYLTHNSQYQESINLLKAELILLRDGCWNRLRFSSENTALYQELKTHSEILFIDCTRSAGEMKAEIGKFRYKIIKDTLFNGEYCLKYTLINPLLKKIIRKIEPAELFHHDITLPFDLETDEKTPYKLLQLIRKRGDLHVIPESTLAEVTTLLPPHLTAKM